MRSRAWRFLVLVVLLASGVGAAWSSWNTSHQIAQLDRGQRDLSDGVDHLLETLASATVAQQAYVTPSPEQDLSRLPDLVGSIRSETERLRSDLRSLDGRRALQAVTTAAATLQDVETRVQEHIRLGQSLMAADLIFSDGRSAATAIASGLRTIRAAENVAYATARADALDVSWTVAGAVGALWVAGLILLTRVPTATAREESPALTATRSPLALSEPAQEAPPAAHPDLQAAADVCTAIGRLTRSEDLPEVLQHAASALDASGMVVWMAAGEELFAAAAFGYPPQVMRKLGPINRSAVNATAAAWRTGSLQAVPGDRGARSALAAPMLGPERCIGVLAVEVGCGQDDNPATRALTMMLAAQLAAALAGWPAASAAAPASEPSFERAAEG